MRSILSHQKVAKRARALRARGLSIARQLPPLPLATLAAALLVGGALLAAGPRLFPAPADVAVGAAPGAEIGADGEPVGSGTLEPARDRDFEHVVEQGETLSEIAYLYELDFSKLALYNNLSNPDAIKPGQKLVIPSITNAAAIPARTIPRGSRLAVVDAAGPGDQLRITADRQTDGRTVTAHFSLEPDQQADLASYEWDLGNGRKSFRDTTYWTYDQPGTYTVTLKAIDTDGRLHLSNRIYIDVPHPGTWRSGDQRFVTLGDVGEPFSVDGEIVEVLGSPSVEESPIVAAGDENGLRTYAANAAGFYNLAVSRDGGLTRVYLFVSPVPSVHVDRADMDWYRTQFNTGTQSNCGPSVISMSLAWALGEYMPVAAVRQTIGWQGDGGISFEDMIRVLRKHGVEASMQSVSGPADVMRIVDEGRIAVLLYNTRSVRRASGDPTRNLFGSYYTDNVGHYVLVKGYSLDRKWLVVYDPIPSDWSANSVRYGDGISMIGRNRYYAANELFATLRRWDVLVVSR